MHACVIDELEQLAEAFSSLTLQLQTYAVALLGLTLHDELTWPENHRAVNAVLGEELYRAKRYQYMPAYI